MVSGVFDALSSFADLLKSKGDGDGMGLDHAEGDVAVPADMPKHPTRVARCQRCQRRLPHFSYLCYECGR
eukprot:11250217-Karenia_brevis.AAC.1